MDELNELKEKIIEILHDIAYMQASLIYMQDCIDEIKKIIKHQETSV